jgi:hypothetical protein
MVVRTKSLTISFATARTCLVSQWHSSLSLALAIFHLAIQSRLKSTAIPALTISQLMMEDKLDEGIAVEIDDSVF